MENFVIQQYNKQLEAAQLEEREAALIQRRTSALDCKAMAGLLDDRAAVHHFEQEVLYCDQALTQLAQLRPSQTKPNRAKKAQPKGDKTPRAALPRRKPPSYKPLKGDVESLPLFKAEFRNALSAVVPISHLSDDRYASSPRYGEVAGRLLQLVGDKTAGFGNDGTVIDRSSATCISLYHDTAYDSPTYDPRICPLSHMAAFAVEESEDIAPGGDDFDANNSDHEYAFSQKSLTVGWRLSPAIKGVEPHTFQLVTVTVAGVVLQYDTEENPGLKGKVEMLCGASVAVQQCALAPSSDFENMVDREPRIRAPSKPESRVLGVWLGKLLDVPPQYIRAPALGRATRQIVRPDRMKITPTALLRDAVERWLRIVRDGWLSVEDIQTVLGRGFVYSPNGSDEHSICTVRGNTSLLELNTSPYKADMLAKQFILTDRPYDRG